MTEKFPFRQWSFRVLSFILGAFLIFCLDPAFAAEEASLEPGVERHNPDDKMTHAPAGNADFEEGLAASATGAVSSEESQETPVNSDGQESFSSKMFEENLETVEQPVYPGVKNCLLNQESPGKPVIKVYYPAFGNSAVDEAIKVWIEARVEYYRELTRENGADAIEQKPEAQEDSDDPLDNPSTWELTGFYTLERPTTNIVSMLFNLYAYTGGAHGNLWLYSLNYDLGTGRQILFDDLFSRPEEALKLLSALSIEKLRKIIGEDTDDEWLERGAGPEKDNFSVLTLVPGGLFVEFQPYQVGPWSIGPQRAFISLEELAAAGPSPKVWNISSVPFGQLDKKTGESENSVSSEPENQESGIID